MEIIKQMQIIFKKVKCVTTTKNAAKQENK